MLTNLLESILTYAVMVTACKVSKYGVISVPYFPVFVLNTEICEVNHRLQS